MNWLEWLGDKGIPYLLAAFCWGVMVAVWLIPGIHWVMYPYMLLTFGVLGGLIVYIAKDTP